MRRALVCFLVFWLCVCSVSAEEGGTCTVVRRGKAEGKIALTFDDGPHPRYTRQVLEVLREYGVKATFFLIGKCAADNPEIVKEIAQDGHELANHTYSHTFLKDLTLAACCKEVNDTARVLQEITGDTPHLFRPPGGSYSDAKLSAISEMGYVSVLWSKDTRDWTCPSVDTVVARATKELVSGDIILFHDGGGNSNPTPQALRQILPIILKEGFTPVTVTELLSE